MSVNLGECSSDSSCVSPRLGVLETAQLALTFSFLFFMGNYSYQVYQAKCLRALSKVGHQLRVGLTN